MGITNQKTTGYGYYTSTIGRMVAVGSPGLPGAQETASQTQTLVLEAGYGRIRLGRVQQTQRPLMPYAHKNNPPKTSAPADCNKVCHVCSAAAVRPLERHFLVLTHHVERPVLDMNNLRGVAVIVDIIDIGVLGRVSGYGLIAVYLSLV